MLARCGSKNGQEIDMQYNSKEMALKEHPPYSYPSHSHSPTFTLPTLTPPPDTHIGWPRYVTAYGRCLYVIYNLSKSNFVSTSIKRHSAGPSYTIRDYYRTDIKV